MVAVWRMDILLSHTVSLLIQVKVYNIMTVFEVNIPKSPQLEKIIIKRKCLNAVQCSTCFFFLIYNVHLHQKLRSGSATSFSLISLGNKPLLGDGYARGFLLLHMYTCNPHGTPG